MAELQFEVVPFGDRWIVLKETRRLSAHDGFAAALAAASRAAFSVRAAGDDCRILVRERTGEWREAPCPEVQDYSLKLRYGR